MKKSVIFNLRAAALLALLCYCAAAAASAQEAATTSEWVKIAPPDEAFTVLMPRAPFPLAESGRKAGALIVAAGRRYGLRHDNAEYRVWSFETKKLPAALADDTESYLDQCAEIAWDLMVEPYWERFKRDSPEQLLRYNLTYDGALPSSGHPGRRYVLNLGEERGLTHIYAVGSRVYIVAASGAPNESAGVERFVKSFALSPQPVPNAAAAASGVTGVGTGSGSGGPGRGGNESISGGAGGGAKEEAKETDYSQTFIAREVTRKAQVLSKPEPSYTESARKFSVIGTVRVRVALLASGKIALATVISKLPHGLTLKAVEAARKIKFEPAVKDGRLVSQYIQVEYNFNIY